MTSRITKKLWKKVPTVKGAAPSGWLTIAEFAKRAGDIKVQAVYKGIENGKVSRKHIAILDGSNEQRKVIIDWDAAAYEFIAQRRAAYRPDDFEENDSHEYKPFKVTPQQELSREVYAETVSQIVGEVTGNRDIDLDDLTDGQQRIVNQRLVTQKTPVPIPTDGTTAKYVKVLLEIEKQSMALRKEANELIDMTTERAILANLSAQLNGNASKAIPKWSPILAAEEDPRVIRQLLKKMFVDIFRPMEENDGDE